LARSLLFGIVVRPPAVSGRFYPADPVELRATVATLLADARINAVAARAIIVPHAGYIYSGRTAAKTFARVTIPGLVIILAPNHTGVCEVEGGVSLWEAGAFRTPLGDLPIDAERAQRLLAVSRGVVGVGYEAHRAGYAVEVGRPFLQLFRADGRF